MKALVSLSGGMDSATLMGYVHEGWGVNSTKDVELYAVSFDYGSKHNKYELPMAAELCRYYNVPHTIINAASLMTGFKSNLLQTGGDIPEGHYTAPTMSQTVVPSRNLIFTSIAAGLAWSIDPEDKWHLFLGIHAGDHAIYPDCRPGFFHHMRNAVFEGTDKRVMLEAPFLDKDKHGILKVGFSMGVPYHITRTCYKDQPIACGKCGSCCERLEAFAKLGKPDPIAYES